MEPQDEQISKNAQRYTTSQSGILARLGDSKRMFLPLISSFSLAADEFPLILYLLRWSQKKVVHQASTTEGLFFITEQNRTVRRMFPFPAICRKPFRSIGMPLSLSFSLSFFLSPLLSSPPLSSLSLSFLWTRNEEHRTGSRQDTTAVCYGKQLCHDRPL